MYRLTTAIICFLLITSGATNASSLPPLPTSQIEGDNKEFSGTEDLSFLQKILGFLGLRGKPEEKAKAENFAKQSLQKNEDSVESYTSADYPEKITNDNDVGQGSQPSESEITTNNAANQGAETAENKYRTPDENLDINDELFAKFDKKVNEESSGENNFSQEQEEKKEPQNPSNNAGLEERSYQNTQEIEKENADPNITPINITTSAEQLSSVKPKAPKQTNFEKEKNLTVQKQEGESETEAVLNQDDSHSTKEKNKSKNDFDSAESKTNKIGSSIISKFKKELEKHKNKRVNDLAIIPESEMTGSNLSEEDKLKNDPKQQKFVNDEAQVLILPNDDVVLGELTEDAKLELIDLSSYAKIFWENYEKIKNSYKKEIIEQFIDNYEQNFNSEKFLFENETTNQMINDAYTAVKRADINKFIQMLNIYPIIEAVDEKGTILHKVAKIGNYPATELLIMKGIDLNIRDQHGQTALSIATKYYNKDVMYLLRNAGAKE